MTYNRKTVFYQWQDICSFVWQRICFTKRNKTVLATTASFQFSKNLKKQFSIKQIQYYETTSFSGPAQYPFGANKDLFRKTIDIIFMYCWPLLLLKIKKNPWSRSRGHIISGSKKVQLPPINFFSEYQYNFPVPRGPFFCKKSKTSLQQIKSYDKTLF